MTWMTRALLMMVLVSYAVGLAAVTCPGLPTTYQTMCYGCTNKIVNTLYCNTNDCQDGCPDCSVALPGNICGQVGHQTCYVATIQFFCEPNGLNRSNPAGAFWNSLKSDSLPAPVLAGHSLVKGSTSK
jgi:hypothetical protein